MCQPLFFSRIGSAPARVGAVLTAVHVPVMVSCLPSAPCRRSRVVMSGRLQLSELAFSHLKLDGQNSFRVSSDTIFGAVGVKNPASG